MQEIKTTADPAALFLTALAGQEQAKFTFQTFADNPSERGGPAYVLHGTYAEVEPQLRSLNAQRHGIFFTVQETDGLGRKTTNIVAPRALYVDQDTLGRPVPFPVPLEPSARVVTSPGKEHVYWFLQPGEILSEIAPALKSLAAELETDKNVAKLAGVLRLPGYYHCKTESPFLSQLIELAPERRYTVKQVLSSLKAPKDERLIRTYALWQYSRLIEQLRYAHEGDRNNAVHRTAWQAKEFVRDGFITAQQVYDDIQAVARRLPGAKPLSESEILASINSGLSSDVESDLYKEAKQALTPQVVSAPTIEGETLPAPAGTASQPTGRVFASGHEADLAREFLKDCGATEGLVRSIGGEFWGYDQDKGVWAILDLDRIKSYVQTLHGSWVYPPNGKVQQLSITPKKRDAIIDLAMYDQDALDPYFFDAAPIGVQFEDGWASIRQGRLVHEPASPDHRCRTKLDYPLLNGPEPEQWLRFLAELFPQDPRLPLILQEAIGAAIFGLATRWQKCLVLLGDGANGKGVLLTALARHLFPPHILSHVPPGRWGHEYYTYALRHSLINLVGELPSWNLVNTDAFKSIIAGDPIIARPPYGRPLSFRPRALHIFAANELPATRDYTHGFWRRFILLPFEAVFTGEEQPEQVLNRFAHEQSGIARWALAGAWRLLQQKTYTKTESQQQAEKEWRLEADPVLGFLTSVGEPGGKCSANELYASFRQWCEMTGRFAVSGVRFGRRLRGLGVEKVRTGQGNVYKLGIRPVQNWGFEV